ncbi:NAD-dependent epimerase/dehydratase family protein [Candidatus Saccharibacteria bacterium]|nr:NAD-dependent epimerase/dehydratase family protein [Candidatus Saccharibacteria bacterium]
MAKCLVLGANGFIGSHLVESLLAAGHNVRCFDRYSSETPDVSTPNAEIYKGDFLSIESLEGALEDIEYVFHFISTTNPFTAENDPLTDIETNLKMSIKLFDLCAKKSIKKVIFASTGGSIYGDTDTETPISEDTCPAPVSPYAIGKLSIENYLRYFQRKHGLDYQVLRISNPYGPGQNTSSGQGVVSIFLENFNKGIPLTIYGDGSMVRDYIYISDLAEMIAKSFEKSTKNKVYNIGSGKGYTVNEIVETIESVTGLSAKVEHKETPSTFVNKIVLDSNRFLEEFEIRPKTDLRKGIEKTWQALKNSQ